MPVSDLTPAVIHTTSVYPDGSALIRRRALDAASAKVVAVSSTSSSLVSRVHLDAFVAIVSIASPIRVPSIHRWSDRVPSGSSMAPTSGHQLQHANFAGGAPRPTSPHPASLPDDTHASRARSSASTSLFDVYSSWSVACGWMGWGDGWGGSDRVGGARFRA